MAALSLSLLLSACTSDSPAGSPEPTPTPKSNSAGQTPGTKPTPEPEPSQDATIVVAAVDTDGLNATVSGFVTGFIEDGGSCEFLFSNNGTDVSAKSTGLADRMSTSCGAVSVPITDLHKGSWTVTLNYSSLSSDLVTSDPVNLEIP